MKSLILAVTLSVALVSVVVLAGKDLPRAEHESAQRDDSGWLIQY